MKKLLFILMILPVLSFAQSPESLQSVKGQYVYDFANVYTPEQENTLQQETRYFFDTVQIAIVTVKSLEGIDKAEYAVRLGNHWGVGSKSDNGLLILIAPNEHKIFVATGRGVQGTMTDMKTGELIRKYATPSFKNGDYYGGTQDLLNATINTFRPANVEIHGEQEQVKHEMTAEKMRMANNIAFAILAFILISIIIFMVIYFNNKKNKIIKEKAAEAWQFLASIYTYLSKIEDELKRVKQYDIHLNDKQTEKYNQVCNIVKWKKDLTKREYSDKDAILMQDSLSNTRSYIEDIMAEIRDMNKIYEEVVSLNKGRVFQTYADFEIFERGVRVDRDRMNFNIISDERIDDVKYHFNKTLEMYKDLEEKMFKFGHRKDLFNSACLTIELYNKALYDRVNSIKYDISNDFSETKRANNSLNQLNELINELISYCHSEHLNIMNDSVKNTADDERITLHKLQIKLTTEFSKLSIKEKVGFYEKYETEVLKYSKTRTVVNDEINRLNEIKRKKEAEEQRIRDEKRRKEEAERKRKKDEEDEERRRQNSYSSWSSTSYDSSSSWSSSSDSSSYSSGSDFGGGSFDGGGAGGDW